jgi:hypothetical protein
MEEGEGPVRVLNHTVKEIRNDFRKAVMTQQILLQGTAEQIDRTPYARQGDADMYTDANVKKRQQIAADERVIELVNILWNVINLEKINSVIKRREFLAMTIKFQRALRNAPDDDMRRHHSMADWARDADGCAGYWAQWWWCAGAGGSGAGGGGSGGDGGGSGGVYASQIAGKTSIRVVTVLARVCLACRCVAYEMRMTRLATPSCLVVDARSPASFTVFGFFLPFFRAGQTKWHSRRSSCPSSR